MSSSLLLIDCMEICCIVDSGSFVFICESFHLLVEWLCFGDLKVSFSLLLLLFVMSRALDARLA